MAAMQNARKQMGHLSYLESHLTDEKLQKEKEMLARLNCVGGPTNISEWYYERTEQSEEDVLAMLVFEYNKIILETLK